MDTSTQFDKLAEYIGTDAACDILNELIAERMKDDTSNFYELDAAERDILWQQYLDRYTGSAADELITDEVLAEHEPCPPLAFLAFREGRIKHLKAKIERYTAYIEADKALLAKHPDKHEYKRRLINHQNKLERQKSSLAEWESAE